jgi:hypothetical protein
MLEDEDLNRIHSLSGVPQDELICPFSRGKWKRVGDALIFFMLVVTPILFLIVLITTKLF